MYKGPVNFHAASSNPRVTKVNNIDPDMLCVTQKCFNDFKNIKKRPTNKKRSKIMPGEDIMVAKVVQAKVMGDNLMMLGSVRLRLKFLKEN